MARIRYHDFRQEDSTRLFNDRFRAILLSGVYNGFNVGVGGSGGLWLKFTHDPDPDNTGSVLGKIITPDGVIIEEDADQDDVVQGNLSAGTPNIHYVVASYTYNAALPVNDVVYAVKQGTSGSPPTPPTLTDDEVLLAEIYLPSGATGYGSAGVEIRTVAKKDLYGTAALASIELTGALKPGIYDGIGAIEGSTTLDVTLESGSWITQENYLVTEASDQTDLFTLTNPGVGQYRYAWIIGAHKFAQEDPFPSPDYLLVEGTAVAIGSQASLPTDTAIRTAVATLNPKYDTDADTLAETQYITKLGYIRIVNRASVYEIDYIRGETVLQQDTIIVYGGEKDQPDQRSGKYYGHEGLLNAFADIQAAIAQRPIDTDLIFSWEAPYKIFIDGEIKLDDASLHIPSCVELHGMGGPARLLSDKSADTVLVNGFEIVYNGTNDTFVNGANPGSTTPPSGYVSRSLQIAATYQSGTGITPYQFAPGDLIHFLDHSSAIEYVGYFVSRVGDFQFECWIEDTWNTDGNPQDVHFVIMKSRAGLINIQVDRISSGAGELETRFCHKCRFDDLIVRDWSQQFLQDCHFGKMTILGDNVSWSGTSTAVSTSTVFARQNVYESLRFEGAVGTLTIGTSEFYSEIHVLRVDGSGTNIDVKLDFGEAKINRVTLDGATNNQITVSGNYQNIVYAAIISGTTAKILVSGDYNLLEKIFCATLELQSGASHTTVLEGSIVTFTDNTNFYDNNLVLKSDLSPAGPSHYIQHANHDRNMHLVSDANIDWDLTTSTLTWDDVIKVKNAWETGEVYIAAGSETLADKERLYIDVDRTAITSVLKTKGKSADGASNDILHQDRLFIALRYGNVIYLYDGTRIEDGQTVKIGSTPPPDNSVTYPKLADSAVAFHNQFFRDYVVDENEDGLENDVVFKNNDLRTLAYTASTGVLQYSASVDLSSVKAGDFVILRNINYTPTSGGQKGFTFEEIHSVDDSNDRVYLTKYLDINSGLGGAHVWNGAIARGNKVWTNNNGASESPVSFSYDETNGRISWSTSPAFSTNHVRKGYLFVDSSLKKYPIYDVDAGGTWVEIETGLRTVDTTTPTSKHQGSVELNNNPHNIPMADLRVAAGAEFIPIDSPGQRDVQDDSLHRGGSSFIGVDLGTRAKCFSNPYDKKIRLYCVDIVGTIDEFGVGDKTDHNRLYLGYQTIDFISVTAVCTGCVLVAAGDWGSTSVNLWLDGEPVSVSKFAGGPKPSDDNTYGVSQNRYTVGSADFNDNRFSRVFRLPLGVHHFLFRVDGFDAIVRGIFLIGHPNVGDTTAVVSDSPGVSVQRGGVNSFTGINRRISVPVSTEDWNKGGRTVRYLDKDGNKQFMSEFVNGFTDTGDVQNGDPDIENVADISQWRVGDLLMVIDSGNKYLRRITAINVGANRITMDSNYTGTTKTSTTVYFYGVCYQGAHDRKNEEIAFQVSMYEFAAGNTTAVKLSGNRGFAHQETTAKGEMGVRLSDVNTAFHSETGMTIEDGKLDMDASGDECRFYFTGTGFSIRATISADVHAVRVDGIDCGLLVNNLTTAPDDDHGGVFVCGELPYGSHMVEIETGASGYVQISGITVWQPKKPQPTSSHEPILELWDSNLIGDQESELGIDTEDGLITQFGTIQYEAGPLMACGQSAKFRDNWVGSYGVNTLMGRAYDWNPGTLPTANDFYIINFFGDEITLVVDKIDAGPSGSIAVAFVDHDGTWRTPTAIVGFTISGNGPNSWTGSDTTVGRRWRYKFSELGYRSMALFPLAPLDTAMDVRFDAIEIHTPFHNHKTKQPISIDHMVPLQLGGRDIRALSPFRSDYLAGSNMPHIQAAHLFNGVTDIWDEAMPFWFYSKGGLTRLTVDFMASDSASPNVTCSMVVDGVVVTENITAQMSASGSIAPFALSQTLILRPGMHFAYIKGASTNVSVQSLKWYSEDITHQQYGNSQRGLGPIFNGVSNNGQSSF